MQGHIMRTTFDECEAPKDFLCTNANFSFIFSPLCTIPMHIAASYGALPREQVYHNM